MHCRPTTPPVSLTYRSSAIPGVPMCTSIAIWRSSTGQSWPVGLKYVSQVPAWARRDQALALGDCQRDVVLLIWLYGDCFYRSAHHPCAPHGRRRDDGPRGRPAAPRAGQHRRRLGTPRRPTERQGRPAAPLHPPARGSGAARRTTVAAVALTPRLVPTSGTHGLKRRLCALPTSPKTQNTLICRYFRKWAVQESNLQPWA